MKKIANIFNENKVVLVILFFGLLYFLFQNQQETVPFLLSNEQIEADDNTFDTTTTEILVTTTQEPIIYVDIKGEVKHPGVYQLPMGARVMDAIDSAGGLTEEADENQLNLALLVSDQMVIFVPNINQSTQEEFGMSQDFSMGMVEESETDGKININLADVAELTLLPGIGEKKAQAIIDYREENGSYQVIEDLMNVSGIGQKTFDKLAEMIDVQ